MIIKSKNSAVRRGVVLGLTSHINFASRGNWHPSYRQSDTVADAWREIGNLLREETNKEGATINDRTNREKVRKSEEFAS